MRIERITVDAAPATGGSYSHAVAHGHTLYVSGQLPLDPEAGTVVLGGIVEQTHQVLRNIAGVLEAAGSSLDSVVRATVYLRNRDDWSAMNGVFGEVFAEALPSRTAIEVGRLAYDALLEVDVIAVRG